MTGRPTDSGSETVSGVPSLAGRIRALPPQRVLVFGERRGRTRRTSGLVEAFEAQGCLVRQLDLASMRRRQGEARAQDAAYRKFEEFGPDLVFAIFPDLPLELLQGIARSTPVAQWCGEVEAPLTDDELELLAASDLPLIASPGVVQALAERGHRQATTVAPGFSRTWFRREGRRTPVRDLAFVGEPGRNGRRVGFLTELAKRHPLTVFGRGWNDVGALPDGLDVKGAVEPSGFRRVCAETRIVLDVSDEVNDEVNDDEHTPLSERTVLGLACGAFCLAPRSPGIEGVIPALPDDGRHLAGYRDLDECSRQIERYLGDPDARARIAEAGHDLVHLRHRWHDRAAELFRLVRLRVEQSAS